MEAINNLLAGDLTSLPSLAILFVVLLLAIILLYFLFRAIFGSVTRSQARGRQPRLSVTDAAVVDDKRRLILVRRDDVEHLVMIGGPSDIVVEQNIVRTASGSLPPARYQQATSPVEPTPEPVPAPAPSPAPTPEARPATPETRRETPLAAAGAASLTTGAGIAATTAQAGSSLTGMVKDTGNSIADTTSTTVSAAADTSAQTVNSVRESGTEAVDALKEEASQLVASVSPAHQPAAGPAPQSAPESKPETKPATEPDSGAASTTPAPVVTSPVPTNKPSVEAVTNGEQQASGTEEEMQRLLDELAAEKS